MILEFIVFKKNNKEYIYTQLVEMDYSDELNQYLTHVLVISGYMALYKNLWEQKIDREECYYKIRIHKF